MAQHTLDTDDFTGISLYGIASHARPYQLLGEINSLAKLQLSHSGKGVVVGKKSEPTQEHPYFVYHDAYQSCQYFVFVNFFNQRYLLPQLKHAHYLLLVTCDAALIKDTLAVIKKCPKVLSFFDLNQQIALKNQIYQWTL